MTREEFIKKYKNDCRYYFDGYYSDCIDDFLTNIYNDHEAQLKAKENHIVELNKMVMEKNEIIDVLHISSSGFNDLYDDYRKLSRKIVAMLFWEWKKTTRLTEGETMDEYDDGYDCGCVAQAEQLFKKSYAMLKAT